MANYTVSQGKILGKHTRSSTWLNTIMGDTLKGKGRGVAHVQTVFRQLTSKKPPSQRSDGKKRKSKENRRKKCGRNLFSRGKIVQRNNLKRQETKAEGGQNCPPTLIRHHD